MPRSIVPLAIALLLAACGGNSGDLRDKGGGVLEDPATGLEWAQRDNGADIDFSEAQAYCTARGAGWRLPAAKELEGLYDRSGRMSVACGTFDSQPMTCSVSPLLRLSGPTPWTDSKGFIFGLSPLRKGPGPIDGIDGARALCVRKG